MKGTRMSLTPLMPAIKSKRLGFELVNENYIGTTSGSAVRVGHIHQRLARWMRSIPGYAKQPADGFRYDFRPLKGQETPVVFGWVAQPQSL